MTPEEATPVTEADLPVVEPGQYPVDAVTDAKKLRFRRALGIAQALFAGDGEEQVWMAAQSMYRNPELVD